MGVIMRNIVQNIKEMLTIPSIFIDGALYAMVALFMFLSSQFGTDEAAKYVSPITLFWLRTIFGALSATSLAVKMFRSTSYADGKAEQKIKTETQFITKP